MTDPIKQLSKELSGIKRFFIVALFIILLSVGLTTTKEISQSKEFFSRQMAERGVATILFFESVFLNSPTPFESALSQEIITNIVSRDHIDFIAITDNLGTILMHSDEGLVGLPISYFTNSPSFNDTTTGNVYVEEKGSRWGFATIKEEEVFIVTRQFLQNFSTEELINLGRYLEESKYIYIELLNSQLPLHAFVGIDPKTMEGLLAQYKKATIFSSLLIVFTATSSFLAILFFQRNFIASIRLRKAENVARKMSQVVSQLEREIRNKEKRAAIGDLAAGVAHELRNPLSSIKGYATYFGQRFEPESNDKQVADIMVQEVDRLNRVITDLLNVSRPTEIELIPTNITLLARNTIILLQQDAYKRNISLEVAGKEIICPLDPDRLRQVLLNLCINGMDSMGSMSSMGDNGMDSEASKLSQTDDPNANNMQNRGQSNGHLLINISENEDFAIIEVTDDGAGIPEHIRSRIFDPYFTTKNHGTGLGLLNVIKIVEAHNGTMEVISEEGKGSTFKIYLPKTIATLTEETFN